jgi:effector-binding domain-containing protein
MKKILAVLSLLAILFFVGIYVILPGQSSFAHSVRAKANPSVTTRILRDESWERWWPVGNSTIDSRLNFKNYQFLITNKLLKGVEVLVKDKRTQFNTTLDVIPLNVDSVKIDWIGTGEYANSPFKRIQQYLTNRDLHQEIQMLMDTLKSYLQQQQNTYGMQIVEERVKDTVLITTKSSFKTYPSISVIYEMIQPLHEYAQKVGLKEMNYPMLHVLKLAEDEYSTMVAIPVHREGPKQNGIVYKRMAPGKILVAEVRGGPSAIRTSFKQFENYLHDHHRISPAIPFESLITDRRSEPDTSKWITKIYYPVF